MRFKTIFTSVILTVMLASTGGKLVAQVAPAARVGGRAIGIGAGVSDYYLDYGPGRRMQGLVARASLGIFHGLGVDGNARTIFMDTPLSLTRMQQNTFLGGVYYEAKPIFRARPFVRMAAGLGTIEFPSKNPAYTRDSYTVFAPSAGFEFPVVDKVYVRAEYEYQFWKEYHGPKYLNPQGVTLGVTYYLRGMHVRPHPMNQLSQ
jgi:opacity protein-like surface antigen